MRTPIRLVRSLRFVVLVLPIAALAQVGPPPPPPLVPLAPQPVPNGNPITVAKANLGKALFWDEQLSSSRTTACGTCHLPEVGGSDPRTLLGNGSPVNRGPDGIAGTADDVVGSLGVPDMASDRSYRLNSVTRLTPQVTGRHTVAHINAGYAANSFWDGRARAALVDPVTGDTTLRAGAALESQALVPITSSVEMAHDQRSWADVAARLQSATPLALASVVPADLAAWIAGRTYPQLFQEAFGSTAITPTRIAMAIATYERLLTSDRAPVDTVIAGGVAASFTPQVNAGFQLFRQLPCGGCHGSSVFSDNAFHYIGVRPASEDQGRFTVTGNPGDLGAMKTPSLRNVALRRSYFHNGRFSTLEDVVAFYNRGGDFPAPNNPLRPLNLTPQQQANLVAFLRFGLTDPRVAARTAPFDRPSLYSQTPDMQPSVLGTGAAGSGGHVPVAVAIEPPLSGIADFTVGIDRALGGAQAVLVIDAVEPPASPLAPASASFARVVTTLQGSGAGNGFGSVALAIPSSSSLQGQRLHGRWYVTDPSAAGGVSWSPAFSFRVFGAGAAGLLAVDPPAGVTLPRALQLSPGRPTPFAGSTLIHYEIATAAPVRLTVFDAQGRSVRRLVEGAVQAAGAYTVTWDGRDDGGRALASGVYFYRLEDGREAATLRTVKLD